LGNDDWRLKNEDCRVRNVESDRRKQNADGGL
jgi:hypothetical protein